MLPDGVHNREEDWTFFFVNRELTSTINAAPEDLIEDNEELEEEGQQQQQQQQQESGDEAKAGEGKKESDLVIITNKSSSSNNRASASSPKEQKRTNSGVVDSSVPIVSKPIDAQTFSFSEEKQGNIKFYFLAFLRDHIFI